MQESTISQRSPGHASDLIQGSILEKRSALDRLPKPVVNLECPVGTPIKVPKISNSKAKGTPKGNASKGKALCKSSCFTLNKAEPANKKVVFEVHEGERSDTEALEEIIFAEKKEDNLVVHGKNLAGLKILGGAKPSAWKPSEEILSFYKAVTNIEFKGEGLEVLKDKYSCDDEMLADLTPSKIPQVIWSEIKASAAET